MAVAGFRQDEIKIDVKESSLSVRGEKKADAGKPKSATCTAALRAAASSAASSSPTMSRSRAPRSATAF